MKPSIQELPHNEFTKSFYMEFISNYTMYKEWTNEWINKCLKKSTNKELFESWIVEHKNIKIKPNDTISFYKHSIYEDIEKNKSHLY